jgi:hypothetical protein
MVEVQNDAYRRAMDLLLGLSVVNLLASLLTLWLIFKMKQYNGYMYMVLSMTLAQAAFDANLFLFESKNEDSQLANIFFGVWCGTAAALWSLIICVVTTYIISSRKYFNIEQNFRYMLIGTTLASIWNAIACVVERKENDKQAFNTFFTIFNIDRILIVVATGLSISISFIQINSYSMFSSKHNKSTSTDNAVNMLAKRLCLYPLVQIVSRLPITVYQLVYDEPLRAFAFHVCPDSCPTSSQKTWFFLSVIFTPAGGAGNFLAFLAVQPNARALLWNLICYATTKTPEMREQSYIDDEQLSEDAWRDTKDTRTSSLYEIEGGELPVSGVEGMKGMTGYSNQPPESRHRKFEDFTEKDLAEMDEEELVRQIASHPHRRQSAKSSLQDVVSKVQLELSMNPVHEQN